MRKQTLAALIVLGLVAGAGCQQQGRPNHAGTTSKDLSRIYFDFDRSEIKSDYKKTMDGNAAWLKKNKDAKVVIEGHCDERGTEEYNVALGQHRAKAAKDYLTSAGIAGDRLSTKSYGEEKPLETCHNESCWWKNRRAEFVKK